MGARFVRRAQDITDGRAHGLFHAWVWQALAQVQAHSTAGDYGHRGQRNKPLYTSHHTLLTGVGLLTDKQTVRLNALFAADAHVQVDATWVVCQRMVAAYRHPDPRMAAT